MPRTRPADDADMPASSACLKNPRGKPVSPERPVWSGSEASKLTFQTFVKLKLQYRALLRRSSLISGMVWAQPTVHLQFTSPRHSLQTFNHRILPLLQLLRLLPTRLIRTRRS